MFLPIINYDLLIRQRKNSHCIQGGNSTLSINGYYLELAYKVLKLILSHFSAIIQTNLELAMQQTQTKDTTSAGSRVSTIGVDISREDRINRCFACYRYLIEARSIIILQSRANGQPMNDKKGQILQQELLQMLDSLERSFSRDPLTVLLRRGRK